MAQNWLYNRFNAFLERHMPEGLFPRALIILVAPVVLLQTIMTGLILERRARALLRRTGHGRARTAGELLREAMQAKRMAIPHASMLSASQSVARHFADHPILAFAPPSPATAPCAASWTSRAPCASGSRRRWQRRSRPSRTWRTICWAGKRREVFCFCFVFLTSHSTIAAAHSFQLQNS